MKKKILALSLIISIFFTSICYAFLPAAFAITGALVYGGITVLDTYLGAAAIVWFCAGVGVYAYNKHNGQSTKATSSGDIKAEGKVTWVELGPNNTLPVKEADITARIPWDKLIAEFNKDKAAFKQKYPNLGSILEDGPDAYNYNMAMKPNVAVGSIVYSNGNFYRINQQTHSNVEASNNYPNGNVNVESNNSVLWFRREVLPSGNAKADRYNVTQIAAPPSTPTTPEKFKYRATGYETAESEVADQYKGDIDKLIKDLPNIVHFEDPITGEKAVPQAATQAQVNAALAAQRAAAQSQQAAQSAENAANNARAAAESARARADAAAVAAAANPGDAGLRQAADAAAAAADAAERAADAAEAARDKLSSDQAQRDADEAKEDSSSYNAPSDSGSAYGNGEEFDFGARLTQLMNELKGTGLFSLPSQILNNIPSGGSSSITFSGGRFGTHTYDFSSWGSILNTLKGILLAIFAIVWIRIVCLKGGSE